MKWIIRSAVILISCFFLTGDAAPPPVRLAFLGDIMLGRGVAQAHSSGGWKDVFSPLIEVLREADFSLANLESPICEDDAGDMKKDYSGGYILNAPESGLEALQDLDLRIVSLANNHHQDCRTTGMDTTITSLKKKGSRALIDGGEPIIIDTVRGRFAFLGFNDVGVKLDIYKASESVAKARRTGATVIVSMHWGLEYQPGANPRQRSQAQALADAGAALIWGHHPHVLQPPAWVQGRGQTRPTLVLYSLGNAIFDQHAPPDAMRSAAVIVAFDIDGAIRMEIFPFIIDPRRGRIISASPTEIDLIYRRMKVNKPHIFKGETW